MKTTNYSATPPQKEGTNSLRENFIKAISGVITLIILPLSVSRWDKYIDCNTQQNIIQKNAKIASSELNNTLGQFDSLSLVADNYKLQKGSLVQKIDSLQSILKTKTKNVELLEIELRKAKSRESEYEKMIIHLNRLKEEILNDQELLTITVIKLINTLGSNSFAKEYIALTDSIELIKHDINEASKTTYNDCE